MKARMNAPEDDATQRIRASYDAIDYDCSAYPATHPDRLFTTATLLGLDPPALASCRVLEIGCGDGSNLIPMAAGMPGASFVGCDLAPRAVATGQRIVQELGLGNIRILQADMRALPAEFGEFDYIIAHGFYSWVPPEVREALMALIAQRLAPNGIAFISYNAMPGGRIRQIAWDALHFHVDRIAAPKDKLAAARTLLAALGEPQMSQWHGDGAQRAEFADLAKRGESALWHDDLSRPNDAFYFHEFVAHAQRHGLTYVSESEVRFMGSTGLAPAMRQLIANEPDRIMREQYLDFARFRRFRQSLLTKATSASNWALMTARIADFQVAAAATLVRAMAEAEAQGKPRESALRDGEPLLHRLLLWLAERAPRTVSVAEIAAWRNAVAPTDPRHVTALLADLYLGGVVDLYQQPAPLVTEPSAKPVASALARKMARSRKRVVNLRHEMVNLSDPFAHQLVMLLDGTRDRNLLFDAMGPQFNRGRDGLEAMLRFCGKVSLLSA
jgi:SAM-dependent methyltransferase